MNVDRKFELAVSRLKHYKRIDNTSTLIDIAHRCVRLAAVTPVKEGAGLGLHADPGHLYPGHPHLRMYRHYLYDYL